MIGSFFARLRQSLFAAEQWYQNTPDRAIAEAYQAAIAIKRIEDEYFEGQPISAQDPKHGAIAAYFQGDLNKNLRLIRNRLNTLKVSRFFMEGSAPKVRSQVDVTRVNPSLFTSEETRSAAQYTSELETDLPKDELLQKLAFIDEVLRHYSASKRPDRRDSKASSKPNSLLDSFYEGGFISDDVGNDESSLSSASFIPRSILQTASRFKKELNPDPEMEAEIIQDFRSSRNRTRAATRFLLLLVLLPLLSQQMSKALVIGPIVNQLNPPESLELQINPAVERRVLEELTVYKERLEFNNLISEEPLSAPEMNQDLRAKAQSLYQDYESELREPIKNIFADGVSLVVFAVLIATGKREISILKAFFDEILYGISDSAKAFILILFTDVFVGFHSPHGWEVVIEGTLEHFGLPQNHAFINMFIATFPVMLDTVFKYWIFRYLNQVSPSAVATYRNMNE
ncbi:MAG: proton extrusion protein PcxA [Cyanobacteria bacterium P01_F01_bin.42]